MTELTEEQRKNKERLKKHIEREGFISLMNDTKWNELRDSMLKLGSLSSKWRTKDVKSGYIHRWDGDWHYHFNGAGSYPAMEWVEIKIDSEDQRKIILNILKQINVPGEETEEGFRIFGYAKPGVEINYI